MTDQEIIQGIDKALLEEFEFNADDMRPEAALGETLGLDSLDYVDMMIVLERAFSFKIRDEEAIRKIRTLGDIHAFVIGKYRQQEREA
jgi:acyl carrier protein